MATPDVTSLSLLERLRNPGDSVAWTDFHHLYAPLLRRWLVRRGASEHDADDIGQEVMRIAVVEMARFEHSGRPGALRCWLRQTMSNQLRTLWRRKGHQPGAVGGSDYQAMAEQLADPQSGLSQLWDAEYRHDVCEHLLAAVEHEFEGRTMDAFRRAALQGKRPAEVAEELGLTANAVRIAQSRVLRRLREIGQGMID
jgi:RNA polymerase sigma-70 factor (ECF subfamily)